MVLLWLFGCLLFWCCWVFGWLCGCWVGNMDINGCGRILWLVGYVVVMRVRWWGDCFCLVIWRMVLYCLGVVWICCCCCCLVLLLGDWLFCYRLERLYGWYWYRYGVGCLVCYLCCDNVGRLVWVVWYWWVREMLLFVLVFFGCDFSFLVWLFVRGGCDVGLF